MSDTRAIVLGRLKALCTAPEAALAPAAERALRPDCVFDVAHPVERLSGRDAVLDGFYRPLRRAFSGVRRRDEIFIGGENRRKTGGDWIASVTHYVGDFSEALFGVGPSGRLAYLRAGEFYRIEGGRIIEAKIIVDLIDLMRQAGRFPLPDRLGLETLWPGPETQDGVSPRNRAQGPRTLDIVEAMLADLHDFDPASFASKGQTGAEGRWSDAMFWYGPGGIGSSYRWEGFVRDHREAFLRAFPDRKGGDHYCRIGDGDYAAVSGWPSMTMTHRGEYLGVAATNRALSLRVMDFYRCAEGRIEENWVLLDYVDLFRQMGVDLLARGAD